MKINEVPQEDANAFGREYKVIQYAVDEKGKFASVKSVGWNPKTVVMQNALDFEIEKAERARQLVIDGKKSPVYYFAKKNMMNYRLLAAYSGFCLVSVFFHCNPKIFSRLSEQKLRVYADVFGLKSVDELKQIAPANNEKKEIA
jgi:hypothetical protein